MATADEPGDMTVAYAKVLPRAALIEVQDAQKKTLIFGSGVVADEDLVLTCSHILLDKQVNHTVKVSLEEVPHHGQIEEMDLTLDMALIKIEGLGVTPITMGASTSTSPGKDILVLGYPKVQRSYATKGIVSCKARRPGILERNISYLQYDAITETGSSGSPVVNKYGELLGMHFYSDGPGFGYAIPVEQALQFINKSKDKKAGLATEVCRFKRVIGLCLQTLPPEVFGMHVENFPKLSKHPVVVSRVISKSPASKAGLMLGDIIVSINFGMVYKISDFIIQMKDHNDVIVYARNGVNTTTILP